MPLRVGLRVAAWRSTAMAAAVLLNAGARAVSLPKGSATADVAGASQQIAGVGAASAQKRPKKFNRLSAQNTPATVGTAAVPAAAVGAKGAVESVLQASTERTDPKRREERIDDMSFNKGSEGAGASNVRHTRNPNYELKNLIGHTLPSKDEKEKEFEYGSTRAYADNVGKMSGSVEASIDAATKEVKKTFVKNDELITTVKELLGSGGDSGLAKARGLVDQIRKDLKDTSDKHVEGLVGTLQQVIDKWEGEKAVDEFATKYQKNKQDNSKKKNKTE